MLISLNVVFSNIAFNLICIQIILYTFSGVTRLQWRIQRVDTRGRPPPIGVWIFSD